MEEKEKFWLSRLEFLKQATIDNYCEEIDFNDHKCLYDYLIKCVFSGEFDSIIPIKSFKNVDKEKQEKIFLMVREHLSLLLFSGNISSWDFSIGNTYSEDYDYICIKLLDNYDFLLGLVEKGGEDVLNLLSSFQDEYITEDNLVVGQLRTNFEDDNILENVLLEMAKKDGQFKDLNNHQKEVLCVYPQNVLYQRNGDEYKLISPTKLIHRLQLSYFGTIVAEYDSFAKMSSVLADGDLFENTVIDVFLNSKNNEKYFRNPFR